MPDQTQIELYTLKNCSGMTAEIMTYGARIVKLITPDKNGTPGDVVLGHDTFEQYLAPGDVFGSVVGRFANRIGGASFEIDGKVFPLTANENGNSLHSAPGGFQDKVWRVKCSDNSDDAPSITLSYSSPDGECGFPGNVDVTVCYTLTTDNALILEYTAKTDHETPLNLTNHTFFNISGNLKQDILSNVLQLNADFITAVDDELIPSGELTPVAGTPYDFNQPKTIGQDIRANDPMLRKCGGYDHNFVISGPAGMKKAGEIYDQVSGRAMLFFTDLPGIQLYTGNAFGKDSVGKGGILHVPHHAFCLETQFFPDSVHHSEFPYANLKPGVTFKTTTIYKFEIR